MQVPILKLNFEKFDNLSEDYRAEPIAGLLYRIVKQHTKNLYEPHCFLGEEYVNISHGVADEILQDIEKTKQYCEFHFNNLAERFLKIYIDNGLFDNKDNLKEKNNDNHQV